MISLFFSRSVYRLFSYALLIPSLVWLIWLSRREPRYRRSLPERLGWIDVEPDLTGCLWIHAASVGEVMAASPLIDMLLKRTSPSNIAVSTNTPTGKDRVENLWGGRVFCFYAPLDTPGSIDRLLTRLRPTMLLTVEREVWPERFLKCREWGVPTVIVNGRLTERSVGQYRRFASFFDSVWSGINLVTTPDDDNAERFRRLGVPSERLDITGNLKFDIRAPRNHQRSEHSATTKKNEAIRRSKKLIVLGSSHAVDEQLMIEGFKKYRAVQPDIVLVIAPRHPSRFNQVSQLLREAGFRTYRTTTKDQPDWAEVDVVLVDEMGQLMEWYRQATICILGGTFGDLGGHNPLEPLQAEKPIIFGPSQGNAQQLFDEISADGSGICVSAGYYLWEAILRLLSAPEALSVMSGKAKEFVARRRGASQKTMLALEERWPNRMNNSAPAIVKVYQPSNAFWLDPDVAKNDRLHAPGAFSWEQNPFFIRALHQGGRGQAFFVKIGAAYGLFRHYRRGGLLGRLIRDTYLGGSLRSSRGMEEFLLLRWARLWGLPVPRPLAAHYKRLFGFRYKANLITEEIIGAESLATVLTGRRLELTVWHQLGTILQAMHYRQIHHADLNCHNLLVDRKDKFWIIDFDKSAIRPGDKWKAENLDRLYRSLKKQELLSARFHCPEDGWKMLLKAYRSSPESSALM